MQITPDTLSVLNNGFNAAFIEGFNAIGSTPNLYKEVCMEVASAAALENYGWMKDLPGMREWVGPRLINNMEAQGMQVANKEYEHALGIKRFDIENDRLNIFSMGVRMQGEIVARHPNELVFAETLLNGFTKTGYDGQYFFDSDHVGYTNKGVETSYSNTGGGSGAPWFLMDLSRTYMRPLIWQLRRAPEFTPSVSPDSHNVFMLNEFLYGVYAVYAASFGFHQLAYGSKDTLNPANYAAARTAMTSQFRPDGSALAVRPTHLVTGPSNLGLAKALLESQFNNYGANNIWYNDAKIIEVPQLG
jgi:phage major head subunit gpT-like protein